MSTILFHLATAFGAAVVGAALTYWLATRKERQSCRTVARAILSVIRDEVEDGLNLMRQLQNGVLPESRRMPCMMWNAFSGKLSGRVLEAAYSASENVARRGDAPSAASFLLYATRHFASVCQNVNTGLENGAQITDATLADGIESATRLSDMLTRIVNELSQ